MTACEKSDRLTRENVLSLVESKDWDSLSVLVFRFLESRFGGAPGSRGNDELSEYLSIFSGRELIKWADRNKWDTALVRCDTTQALQDYLVRCFKNYASKQSKFVSGEPVALRRQVNRLLKNSKDFTDKTVKSEANEYVFYGLKIWLAQDKDPEFYKGEFYPNPEIEKSCFRLGEFTKFKGKYAEKDLIKGCKLFLETISAYARAYVISDAVAHFWAPCVNFNLSEFINIEEREFEDEVSVKGFFLEDLLFLVEEILVQMKPAQRFVLMEYTLPSRTGKTVKLADVAERMGCSHGTVHNRDKEVLNILSCCLKEVDREDCLLICNYLPKFLENTQNGPLSPMKASSKGEV